MTQLHANLPLIADPQHPTRSNSVTKTPRRARLFQQVCEEMLRLKLAAPDREVYIFTRALELAEAERNDTPHN